MGVLFELPAVYAEGLGEIGHDIKMARTREIKARQDVAESAVSSKSYK